MRLFIAIRLSDEMKKALINCNVPAQNLHMTLAFIGEYDDPEKVKKVLKKVPMPEFRLSLSEKGNFGNILWAGVKGNQKLKAYVKELRAALDEEGIPYDRSSFVPHITMIRKVSAKKPYQVHLGKAVMTVKRASLMKSEQKNGKMVYQEL